MTAAAQERILGGRDDFRIDHLPLGRLRNDALRLPPREKAEAEKFFRRFHFPEHDCHSLHIGRNGGVFYACEFFPAQEAPAGSAGITAEAEPQGAPVPVSPFPPSLEFQSRPGSPNVLFLDFDGHVITGTQWNADSGVASYTALPFSLDADTSTYSEAEQIAIKRIWQRVAEDYSPFDINVTTRSPTSFNSRTLRCLITRSRDASGVALPSSTAGGVSYVGVFGTGSLGYYSPSFVYPNNLSHVESYIAEAATHECGHAFGLSHDGTTSNEYYGGHGTGETSWAPIMGTGYGKNITQWSKGEYYQSNNPEDDLSILAGKLSYRPDDAGNTPELAAYLTVEADGSILVTTPETDPENSQPGNKGILERNTDVDVWAFNAEDGPATLSVHPWVSPVTPRGGNLDIRMRLMNEAKAVLADIGPANQASATLTTNLVAGLYYLEVSNAGTGSPLANPPTGYTAYGGVGQYFISGTVQPAGAAVVPPQAAGTFNDIMTTGVSNHLVQVVYSDNVGIHVSTLDGSDLRVTGPYGYSQNAAFVSVNNVANGTPRTATYRIPPPNGVSWVAADKGTYTVEMLPEAVSDVEGAYVPAGTLGTFEVDVPIRVYFADMNTNPGWTLTPDWEYGPAVGGNGDPANAATGTNLIGYAIGKKYPKNLSPKYATTPPIHCVNHTQVYLQFKKWLTLGSSFLGEHKAWIEVSTNGTTWAEVWSTTSSNDSSWKTILLDISDIAAHQPAVQIRWGLSTTGWFSNPSGGWSLDDVEVLGDGGPSDTTAPVASFYAQDIASPSTLGHSFTVTYTDNVAIATATLDDEDVIVVGPNGYSHTCARIGLDEPLDGTPRVATYQCPPPPGGWNYPAGGLYQVYQVENQVFDSSGNPAPAKKLGDFRVDMDLPEIIVLPDILEVPENGTATWALQLSAPLANAVTVTVSFVSGDPDLQLYSGEEYVFTPGNYAYIQTVEIYAGPDADQQNSTALFRFSAPGLDIVEKTAVEIDNTPDVLLTTRAEPEAWGHVTPLSGSYPVGATVMVHAVANAYYRFAGWTGDIVSEDNPLSLVVNTPAEVTAHFVEEVTSNTQTPLAWLAAQGFTNHFEAAALQTGTNRHAYWESYVAGLNPNDPNSTLRMEITVPQPGENVLHWQTVSGRVYTVRKSASLLGIFSPLDNAVQLPWTTHSVTDHVSAAELPIYYRLEVERP